MNFPEGGSAGLPHEDPLLAKRIIFLGQPISDPVATEVIAKLLFLQRQSVHEPIALYINSPGGLITAALAIIDTMESLTPPVQTCCIGLAHSAAAAVLGAGTRSGRTAMENSRIQFSEPFTGGEFSPAKLADYERLKTALFKKILDHTGMQAGQLQELYTSEKPLTALEALKLEIIDFIGAAR